MVGDLSCESSINDFTLWAARFLIPGNLFFFYFSYSKWSKVYFLKLHCPGPTLFYSWIVNLSSFPWKDDVPAWPNLTITLLFFFLIVCTIGSIIGRLIL